MSDAIRIVDYFYLMVPDNIEENAERRLKVLEHHTELGAPCDPQARSQVSRGHPAGKGQAVAQRTTDVA